MHLDLSAAINIVSAITLIGALLFTALQVREANRARRDQAAVAVIQTALSENSARMLGLFAEISENASAEAIEQLDPEKKRALLEFGLRLEVVGYMVFRRLVELKAVNDLMGGVTAVFWSRARAWAEERRRQTGHLEFLEWCEWLVEQVRAYRETHPYQPAHLRLRESAD